jgi:hypothetical protein
MVVVYSGDSDRPPPCWDAEVPSERPTYAHFVTVPSDHREPLPPAAGEPFLPANTPVDGGEEAAAAESVARPNAARDPRMSLPTLRLATWPSADEERLPVPRAAQDRRGRTRRRWPFVVFGLLGFTGLVLAFPTEPGEPPPPPVDRAAPSEVAAPAVMQPAPGTAERVEASPPAPEASASTPEAQPLPPARPAAGKFQRVTLEVFPADAKVIRRGVRQPGPPYSFKIPKGKTVSIEVAKKGFVTRKVVLDGSESPVVVGLFRKSLRQKDTSGASKSVGSGL